MLAANRSASNRCREISAGEGLQAVEFSTPIRDQTAGEGPMLVDS